MLPSSSSLTKSRPKVEVTPAALVLLQATQVVRLATQRATLRALRTWRSRVDEARAEEERLAATAPSGGGGGGSRAQSVRGWRGSESRRARSDSNAASPSSATVAVGSLTSLVAPPNSLVDTPPSFALSRGALPMAMTMSVTGPPRSPVGRFSVVDREPPPTLREEDEDASDRAPDHTPVVRRAASASATLRVGAPSSSASSSLSVTPVSGRRSLAYPSSPVGESDDTSSRRVSHAGGWTSSRPVRPSIIATRRLTQTLPAPPSAAAAAAAAAGIHPSLLSPTVAFRRSIIVRDSAIAAAMANAGNSGTTTPQSPARMGLGAPVTQMPHGMQAHPRGSVMLGDIKEWRDATSASSALTPSPPSTPGAAGQDADLDVGRGDVSAAIAAAAASLPDAEHSGSNLSPPLSAAPTPDSPRSPHSPLALAPELDRRRSHIVQRWRGAVRQVIALSLWAKRRNHTRQSVEGANDTAAAASTNTDEHALPHDGPGASTATLTPRSTLVDYFLVFGLPTSALAEASSNLRALAAASASGLVTRRALEALLVDANESLAEVPPEVQLRFPQEDRPHFPLDPHWGAFGFQEGPSLSMTPRPPACYASVMTTASGLGLFATYLKFDVPLLSEMPSAFLRTPQLQPIVHSSPLAQASPSESPSPQVRFWDDAGAAASPSGTTSPQKAASPAAGATASAGVPSPEPLSRGWSSPAGAGSPTLPGSMPHSPAVGYPSAVFQPQLYAPRCLVLVSHYPQLEVMRVVAQQLFALACEGGVSPRRDGRAGPGVTLAAYVRALCHEIPLPVPRRYAVSFRIHRAVCTTHFPGVRAPTQSALPLSHLFRALNVDNVLGVLAAMLTEHRILFHSASLMRLTQCMQCFLQLLHPFQFWYSFVPHLTSAMLDAHEIPQPYMLGVHSSHLAQLESLEDVLIVDLDHDVLRCTAKLTTLPPKDGRELWNALRRAVERDTVIKTDQITEPRLAMPATHPVGSPQHASMPPSSSIRPSEHHRASSTGSIDPAALRHLTVASPPPAAAASPGSKSLSPAVGSPPVGGLTVSSQAFHFDTEVYAAMLRFYVDLLVGYRKFLFFIQEVPFFNAQGFLAQRVARDPPSLAFFQRLVASRAFDVFVEEEAAPDAFHDHLATGTPVNRAYAVVAEDAAPPERVLCIPEPAPDRTQEHATDAPSPRVEVEVRMLSPDEPVQSVILDAPSFASDASSTNRALTSCPFEAALSSTSPSPPLRAFHWPGLEYDLEHYNLSTLQPTPRKPKQLTSDALVTEESSATLPSGGGGGTSTQPSGGALNGHTSPAGGGQASLHLASPGPVRSASTGALASAVNGKRSASEPATGEQRLKQMLSQLFSAHDLSKEEMRDFAALLRDSTCRRAFAIILSQPRTHGAGIAGGASGHGHGGSGHHHGGTSSLCLTPRSFEQLASLVHSLLDACLASKDYASATAGALDAGNVYYTEADASRNHARTYLESTIKTHALWQTSEFWRANLALKLSQRAVAGQRQVTSPTKSSPTSPTPAPITTATTTSAASDDEFILQWLIASAHQMLANGVPHRQVDAITQDVCNAHRLAPESRDTIASFLDKIKAAAQYW